MAEMFPEFRCLSNSGLELKVCKFALNLNATDKPHSRLSRKTILLRTSSGYRTNSRCQLDHSLGFPRHKLTCGDLSSCECTEWNIVCKNSTIDPVLSQSSVIWETYNSRSATHAVEVGESIDSGSGFGSGFNKSVCVRDCRLDNPLRICIFDAFAGHLIEFISDHFLSTAFKL